MVSSFARAVRPVISDGRASRARVSWDGIASDASSDSGKDRLGRELEPGGEVDAGPVAERLARGADVGPGVANVPGAWRLVALLDGFAEDETDRLGDVVHAR